MPIVPPGRQTDRSASAGSGKCSSREALTSQQPRAWEPCLCNARPGVRPLRVPLGRRSGRDRAAPPASASARTLAGRLLAHGLTRVALSAPTEFLVGGERDIRRDAIAGAGPGADWDQPAVHQAVRLGRLNVPALPRVAYARAGPPAARSALVARPQRAFPARRRKRSHPRDCDSAASHSSTRSTGQASAVHLASARPRPARAGRSGRGCRRRACRAGGRRGP